MRKNRHKRKNKVRVIWVMAIVFLSLAVIIGLLIFQQKIVPAIERKQEKEENAKPDHLLKQYYSFLEKDRYEDMYHMIDTVSQSNISQEEFISRNKKIYEGIEAKNIQLQITGMESGEEDEAVISYDVKMDTVAGDVTFSNQTLWKAGEQENVPYTLSWTDSMIFPGLASEDKVRVSVQEAKRGNLLDRNGNILSGEGTASSVGLVPGKMNADSSKDIQEIAKILGISPESIQKKLDAAWVKDDSFVPIKTVEKLTQLEQTAEEPDAAVIQKKERDAALLTIPGVMLSDTLIRQYPLGEAASHLTGYLQKVTAEDLEKHPEEGYNENSMIGRSGMESLFEQELRGQNGYEITITDTQGQTKEILAAIPRQDGSDIKLTIDAFLQREIYNTYAQDKSCTVAMNPYTGEVLALVSTPSFNSNDFILGMSQELWDSLNQDERKPLYNRFRQKLCPGSSFKPVVGAIGLKTGAVDPAEDYGSEGLSWQKDSSWGKYHVTTLHAAEPAVLENALIYSDNIYFAKAALNIGQEKLEAELKTLGFGEKLPFEIDVAESQFSNADHIESEIQLADSGYGQGQILVNPIHLAALYTGFANQGDVIKPHLVYQENAAKETWLASAYKKEQAKQIESAMIQVVESEHGTGHGAFRPDVSLAGKTGTAEIKLTQEDTNGTELGWFGVYTADQNTEKPLFILSMAEDVKGRGGSGYVVDKTKEILDAWFLHRE